MKKTISFILMAAALCGCSTTSSVFTGPTANGIVEAAAYDGTIGALAYNPAYRAGFVEATNVLTAVNVTNLTSPMAISDLLSSVKVGGAKATYVPQALNAVFVNLNAFGVNFQALQSTNAPAALAALSGYQQSILTGISLALAQTP